MIVLGQIAPAIKLPSSGATTQKCSSDRIFIQRPDTGATRCTTSCPSGWALTRDSRTNTRYCRPLDLRCSATQMVKIDDRTWARSCVAKPIGKTAAEMSPQTVSPTTSTEAVKKPTGATAPTPTMPAVPAETPEAAPTATTAPARPPLSRGAKIAMGVGALSLVAGGAALFLTRR